MQSTVIESSGVAGGTMQPQEQQTLMQEEEMRKKTNKVLVAIDESEVSLYALKWALDYLFPYSGPTPEQNLQELGLGMVTLVHVIQPFHHYIYPAGPVADSVRKAQEENAAAILSRALQICKEKKLIKAETLILEGDPKDMICQATEQMHVDVLVVGSRGLGKIKRAFLGSVSDYCAHHAKCPILIVKPSKELQK